MAKCPNCKCDIAWDVPTCPKCAALFSVDSFWRPVPDDDNEAEAIANRYAEQFHAHDEPQSFGGGLWTVFMLFLSLVLMLLVVLFGVMAFRGPQVDWRSFGFLGLFVFLAALPWVDFTKPSRALALTVVVVALGIGFVGHGYLTGATKLPQSCSGRSWWLCELENELYQVGGAAAVAAIWYLSAAFMLYGAYRLFIRSPKAS